MKLQVHLTYFDELLIEMIKFDTIKLSSSLEKVITQIFHHGSTTTEESSEGSKCPIQHFVCKAGEFHEGSLCFFDFCI